MSDRKTTSILQRLPVIPAVTAASYGLQLPVAGARQGDGGRAPAKHSAGGQQAAAPVARPHHAKA